MANPILTAMLRAALTQVETEYPDLSSDELAPAAAEAVYRALDELDLAVGENLLTELDELVRQAFSFDEPTTETKYTTTNPEYTEKWSNELGLRQDYREWSGGWEPEEQGFEVVQATE